MYGFLLNFLYLFALVALSPWIVLRGTRKGSLLLSWRQRWFGLVPHLGDIPIIWLHAVSVGEVNLLGALVRELKKQHPNCKVAISSTTAAGLRLANNMFPQDIVIRFPLDLTWAVNRVFVRWNVTQIILAELELWPNLLRAANRRSVPVSIINGRLSESSYSGYKRIDLLSRSMFKSLSFVGAQSDEYAARFRKLGVPECSLVVTGNIKFDNCELDPFTQNSQALRNLLNLTTSLGADENNFRQGDTPTHRSVPIWVAGSTQEGEELIVLNCYQKLREQYPTLRLILVPRHPERANSVYELTSARSFAVVKLSELKAGKKLENWSVLLVDTVGDLKWVWSLADIAFVGGSFGDRGGQNMIEPAALGASVAVGPNTRNFAEVVSILRSANCLTQLNGPDELSDWAFRRLSDSTLRNAEAMRAREIISAQRGALSRTLQQINNLLGSGATHQKRAA